MHQGCTGAIGGCWYLQQHNSLAAPPHVDQQLLPAGATGVYLGFSRANGVCWRLQQCHNNIAAPPPVHSLLLSVAGVHQGSTAAKEL
jgi:hypothetical protein